MQGRYRDGIPEDEKKRLFGCAFSVAILIAPFIALLYSMTIAVVVLILALGTATWFAWEASRESEGQLRARLIALTAVNALLLAASLAALIWLETG